MPYAYSNPAREADPHALPDVEVFHQREPGRLSGDAPNDAPLDPAGWYYAFGFPGCLWDSEPVGPFESESAALAAARDEATE